MSKVFYVNIR